MADNLQITRKIWNGHQLKIHKLFINSNSHSQLFINISKIMLWENKMLKNRLKRLKKPREIYRSCKNSLWKRKRGSSSSSEKLNRCQRSSNSNMKRSLNLWRRKLSLKSLRSREKRKKKRSRWFISKNCTKERCKGSSYRCKFTRGSRTTKMGEMMKFTDSSSKLRI